METSMSQTGNKGEWSEFYTLVQLLATGKLYVADGSLNYQDNEYFPIIKVLRRESAQQNIEYIINPSELCVEVHINGHLERKIPQADLCNMAAMLYTSILQGSNRAFAIAGADEIMQLLGCMRTNAPATEKADITLQFYDPHTGFSSTCGFSIKSELGNPPTLLNASKATNFVFAVTGLNNEQMEHVNNINTTTKIIDRINAIYGYDLGHMEYRGMNNVIFNQNLTMIDPLLPNILGELLFDYYRSNIYDCRTLVARLEQRNPLNFPQFGMYEVRFKKLLYAVALGMMPSKRWNGQNTADGGYIVVKENGAVVSFQNHNREAFENYLFNNVRFERASTSRHGFASLYIADDGNMYMNLNLQIRFTSVA